MEFMHIASIVLIGLVSFLASASVYRSGLPLPLILMAVLPWFLPISLAVFTVACVHFLDFLVKFSIIRRRAQVRGVLVFGLLSMIGSWFGAEILIDIEAFSPLYIGDQYAISIFTLVVIAMVLLSAAAEWATDSGILFPFKLPSFLAGFICGLAAGMSGVFESFKKMVYRPVELNFVQLSAVAIVSSLFTDMVRLPVYLALVYGGKFSVPTTHLALSAGLGAVLSVVAGIRYLKEVREPDFRRWCLWIVMVSALGLVIRNML